MRNILVNVIDNIMDALLKLRYKLLKDYADPSAKKFLDRWKKAYPATFGGIHTPLIGKDNKEVFKEPPISGDISDIIATPHKEL